VSEEKHMVCTIMPKELYEGLAKAAQRKGTYLSDVVREAVRAYLFLGLDNPPKADIDMTERMVVFLFELLKATYGDRK